MGEGLPRPKRTMPGCGTGFQGAQFTGPGCCSITQNRSAADAAIEVVMEGRDIRVRGQRPALSLGFRKRENARRSPTGYESQEARSRWSKAQ